MDQISHVILDIETSDLKPGMGEILEVAAIDLQTGTTFYRKVRYRSLQASPETLRFNHITFEELDGEDRDWLGIVDEQLAQWLSSLKGRVHLVGFNVASFDQNWLEWKMPKTASRLHYRAIEVNSFLSGHFKKLDVSGDRDVMDEAVMTDIPESIKKLGKHNALFDCYYTLGYLMRCGMEFPFQLPA